MRKRNSEKCSDTSSQVIYLRNYLHNLTHLSEKIVRNLEHIIVNKFRYGILPEYKSIIWLECRTGVEIVE